MKNKVIYHESKLHNCKAYWLRLILTSYFGFLKQVFEWHYKVQNSQKKSFVTLAMHVICNLNHLVIESLLQVCVVTEKSNTYFTIPCSLQSLKITFRKQFFPICFSIVSMCVYVHWSNLMKALFQQFFNYLWYITFNK